MHVIADVSALYRVYLGRMSLAEALDDELVQVGGPRSLVRQFPRWFAWSSFAPAARAALQSRLPYASAPADSISGKRTRP